MENPVKGQAFRYDIRAASLASGLLLFIVFGLSAVAGCRSSVGPDRIRATGMIERAVEGCYRIVTSDRAYQPINLPQEFQSDRIRVRFEAVPKPTFNTCQAGEVIELITIERL